MGKRDKFLELENYFRPSLEDRISLTFKEIEQILGFSLSHSAYDYAAYWYVGATHTLPNAWINEGYKLESLNLEKKTVSFIKVNVNIITPESKIKFIEHNKLKGVESKKTKLNIDINFAIEKIKEFYNESNRITNSRYKSWEHCYKFFNENKEKGSNKNVVDDLSLHLAFYLASWGMYRGSSFLLQKDYKVHYDAILEILKEKYKPLWGITSMDMLHGNNLSLISEVTKELKKIYIEKRQDIDGHKDVSNILITKILLGTFGCVPAYDRFFISGIKIYEVTNGNFNIQSIIDLANFYINNNEQFEKCRTEISNNDLEYPQMKLIDMCFWKVGFDNSIETERKIGEEI